MCAVCVFSNNIQTYWPPIITKCCSKAMSQGEVTVTKGEEVTVVEVYVNVLSDISDEDSSQTSGSDGVQFHCIMVCVF
jgi:hypothetical protein